MSKFDELRQYTQARVGLGSKGAGLPTKSWLEFSYQHAAAVDSIHVPWRPQGNVVYSEVSTRGEYLLRPDKGRRLSAGSKIALKNKQEWMDQQVLIVASNGLSTFAVENHLQPFLVALNLQAPVLQIENARVGIIDDIGEILRPEVGIILIGERPGLSSADSLAMYLTYRPRLGRTDADRNCVSNIRPPHGLSYSEAAFKTKFLINESLTKKLSGVELKERSGSLIT